MESILEASGVVKHFGGVAALRNMSVAVRRGEIHALLGENGAGKSTFIKVLAGVYERDAGELSVSGEDLPVRFPASRVRELGVSFIHQNLALIKEMTVWENIAMVAGFATRRGIISERSSKRIATEHLATVGSHVDPLRPVSELNAAEEAMVAIARALVAGATLIVLDEPTARLSEPEVEQLFGQMHAMREVGVAFLYVTHRLEEVFAIADRATIVRDGVTVAKHDIGSVSEDQVISAIVGRDLAEVFPERVSVGRRAADAVILQLDNVTTDYVANVTLGLRRGEIVGVTGLITRASTSLARAAYGIEPRVSGTVRIDGRAIEGSEAAAGPAAGIAYVPPDRQREGLALDLTVRENVALVQDVVRARRQLREVLGPLRRGRSRNDATADLIRELRITPANPESLVSTLSGGNQQKVLLAKWIAINPKVLILEEPTAGVDIGTRAQIYQVVLRLTSAGTAVLLVSSDFEEVAALAHRVVVLRRGRVALELSGDALTRERLATESYRVAA